MTDRWHDNWRNEETPEEKIERRFAAVDKLGEWGCPECGRDLRRINGGRSDGVGCDTHYEFGKLPQADWPELRRKLIAERGEPGEWSGQDKPTLMDTAKRLNAIKGEYGLSGEEPREDAVRASRDFAVATFKDLGFDYDDVHALACRVGLTWADALIAVLKERTWGENELRLKLMTEFGDTWIDGVLLGATHRKAVE